MSEQFATNRRWLMGAAACAAFATPLAAIAATSAKKLLAESRASLDELYGKNATAKALGAKAKAVLIFPGILKAGFVVGGQGGEGTLFEGGKTSFYRIAAGSIGFQAGAQKFGYALFFITEKGLDYMRRNDGWAIGTGPSVVFVEAGAAAALDTSTLKQDVYAVAFDQKGLMASLSLEGSKISRIHPT